MTPERFQRAKQLFADLCERPPHERRARLRAACGDDAELQAQVESLLQIDTQRPDFLSAPAFSGTRLREVAEQSSQDVQNACVLPALSIRGFRLLRVIGEGGMGVVYEAEQEHPRRTVALKIIRPGLMSHRILRRFQQEADILGQLQHPGIAQIYEAGMAEIEGSGFRVQGSDTSADARVPFFAMEFVRGQPLIDYATQHELGTRQRLELIAKVCDAVQHAHQHSVIHRDLKPANILVVDDSEPLTPVGGDTRALKACTSRPAFAGGILSSPTPIGSDVAARATPRPRGRGSECIIESAIPKILDFGVARLTDSDVQVTTVQTDVGQLIGTIPYMSPEQIVGDPQQVDARADIYALGVILYELLSGRLPLDVRHRSIPEAARMIREEEPSRLSSIKAMFRGDIETIVAKALEKEPQRRYASASELAADIRRYLADQPIAARPASTLYQLRKFAKRNRALVGGVASTLLVLMAGAVAATILAIRADRQRGLAQRAAQVAREEQLAARRLAYRASIAAAAAALAGGDVAAARSSLRQAPAELRGWEWQHFDSTCDASLQVVACGRSVAVMDLNQDGSILRAITGGNRDQLLTWNLKEGASQPRAQPQESAWRTFDATVEVELTSAGVVRTESYGGRRREFRLPQAIAERVGRADGLSASSDGRWILFFLTDVGLDERAVCIADLDSRTVRSWSDHYWRWSSHWCFGAGQVAVFCIGDNPEVHVWDLTAGTDLVLPGHALPVGAVAVSPDGRIAASVSKDRTVRTWSLPTGQPLAIGRGHTDSVRCVAFSPDGQRIATGGDDRSVRIWDSPIDVSGPSRAVSSSAMVATPEESGNLNMRAVLYGHESFVTHVSFSRDGQRVLSSGTDGTIRIWDATLKGDPNVLIGHSSYVYPVAFAPTTCPLGSGTLLASAGWDHTIRLWDSPSGDAVATLRLDLGNFFLLAFSADGARLASFDDTRTVRSWDVLTGTELAHLYTGHEPSHWVRRVAFHPDDRRICIWDSQVRALADVWDPLTGEITTESSAAADAGRAMLASSDGRLTCTLLQDDDHQTAVITQGPLSGSESSESRIAISGRNFAWCPRRDRAHWLLASPAEAPQDVCVWDALTGQQVAVLRGHSDEIFCIAFSPDGRRIATGARDAVIRIWDGDTFEPLAELRGHTSYVWSLAWSADGSMLVSGSGDQTVRIWDSRPPGVRLRAREERATLLARLQPLVDSLYEEHDGNARAVVDRLSRAADLTPREREIALQALLARSAPSY